MNVALVTDSTAILPAAGAGSPRPADVRVVPLQVVVGGRALSDGLEVSSGDVAAALSAGRPVTTSRPSPGLFVRTYRELAAAGHTGIVSVHLSAEMSGTADAARLAAAEVAGEVEVRVVDSRTIAVGLGHAVLAGARLARDGAAPAEVARAAARRGFETQTWIYVDTLEHLHRGGRIGTAAAFVGSALAVKPLLQLVDGRLEAIDKVRTSARALTRLEETVVAAAGPMAAPVAAAVHHLAAAERAQVVADRLTARLGEAGRVEVVEVGAVIGAHVGPGMIAVVIAPST